MTKEKVINIAEDDPELHTLLVNWCNNPRIRNKELLYYHGIVYNTRLMAANKPEMFNYEPPSGLVKEQKQIINETLKIGPNQPCQCGSGRKYKKCCG